MWLAFVVKLVVAAGALLAVVAVAVELAVVVVMLVVMRWHKRLERELQ